MNTIFAAYYIFPSILTYPQYCELSSDTLSQPSEIEQLLNTTVITMTAENCTVLPCAWKEIAWKWSMTAAILLAICCLGSVVLFFTYSSDVGESPFHLKSLQYTTSKPRMALEVLSPSETWRTRAIVVGLLLDAVFQANCTRDLRYQTLALALT